jgi:enoyl-[acyl-carrier-protein] reductase (NADH)
MKSAELTNLLIGIVIALITYVSKRMIDKMDAFEQKLSDILMSDVANKKDIESLKANINDHETRLQKLES